MMQWNYWGTGHGKGPHDGARACFKQAIKKEQLKAHGENLKNIHDVVFYLQRSMNQPHTSYEGAKKYARKVSWEVKERDLNRTQGFDCKSIVRFWSMHSMQAISALNNILLEVRDFSCLCHHYIEVVLSDYAF